ncbi:MAG TPA: hypothetical protein VJC08_00835 [bacterium]|nr:hypothetical protein [bacterium]
MKHQTGVRGTHSRWNLLDFSIIVLVILAVLAVYFTFVRPIQFSNKIKRESLAAYAEIEILLPEDIQFMKNVLQAGEEKKDVYGTLEWKILEIREEEVLPGEKRAVVKLKAMVYTEPSAVPRYGKYPLMPASQVLFANSRYMFEGRLMRYRLLDEKTAT